MTETEAETCQQWRGMDGRTAFHLIERHADGWEDIAMMMGAWHRANLADDRADAAGDERAECAQLLRLSAAELLLLAGEMTAQELRTVQAVLKNRAAVIMERPNLNSPTRNSRSKARKLAVAREAMSTIYTKLLNEPNAAAACIAAEDGLREALVLIGGSGEVEITAASGEKDYFGCPACIASERDEQIAKLKAQRDELLTALGQIKSNLLHHRFGGSDTLQSWKNAAWRAEADAEEAIAAFKGLTPPYPAGRMNRKQPLPIKARPAEGTVRRHFMEAKWSPSADDVRALCEAVTENYIVQDSINGADYCRHCGKTYGNVSLLYLQAGKKEPHERWCPVLVAQDVMTGMPSNA